MQTFASIAIILFAAVAVIASLTTLIRDKQSERGATTLIGLTALTLVVYETELLSTGPAVQLALLGISSVLGIHLLLTHREYWRKNLNPAMLLPAVLAATTFATNAIANPSLPLVELLARAAPIVFWVTIGILVSVSRISAPSLAAIGGLILGVSSLAAFLGDPWRACDQFKCGLFDSIFTGPFSSENYLAQVATIAILFVTVRGTSRQRPFVILLGATVLLAATSRTAAISLGIALVLGFALSRPARSARTHLAFWLVASGALASVLIVSNASPADYSNRGGIWRRTLATTQGNEWLGAGISRWSAWQQSGLLPPSNFPHNQLILIYFSAGVVGCAVYLIVLWRLLRTLTSNPNVALAATTMISYLLVSGITEVMWNPATIDGHCFVILAVLILNTVAPPALGEGDERKNTAPSRRRTSGRRAVRGGAK